MAKAKVQSKPKKARPVTYIGSYPRVHIPELGRQDRWVGQGETVELPGDLVDRLIEQAGNWAEPKDGKGQEEQAPQPAAEQPEAEQPADEATEDK